MDLRRIRKALIAAAVAALAAGGGKLTEGGTAEDAIGLALAAALLAGLSTYRVPNLPAEAER